MNKSPFTLSKGTLRMIFIMFQLTALALVCLWLGAILTIVYAVVNDMSFQQAWLVLPERLLLAGLFMISALVYVLLPDTKDTGKKPSTMRVNQTGDLDHIEETTYHD